MMNKSSVLNYLSQHYLLFLLIAGCQTLGTSSAAPGGLAVARNASQKCLQIYYDAVPSDPKMTRFGRLHALHLDNLVGHFPKIQTYVIPLARYQAGDIERCASSIYLGTYYDAPGDVLARLCEDEQACRLARLQFLEAWRPTREGYLGHKIQGAIDFGPDSSG